MDRVDYQSLIIQDLINDEKDGKLNLNPWYQRRSVWTSAQKSYLINTLFQRKPIPAIYIRHSIDIDNQKSVKEIVDGQQRCRSIIEYCRGGSFSARYGESFERVRFNELKPAQRERFLLTPLPIGFLLGATDSDVIDIFARINSVSKTLNPQEKRNAQFSGEFKQFCLEMSSRYLSFWRNANIFTANDISRMGEVQFISDLIVNLIEGVSDFQQRTLSKYYEENDEVFERARDIEDRVTCIFDVIHQIDVEIFRNTIFNRQPIFFSLLLCIDQMQEFDIKKIEENMYNIDAEFNDEEIRGEDIVEFRNAVASTTQRLRSRNARNRFLNARL